MADSVQMVVLTAVVLVLVVFELLAGYSIVPDPYNEYGRIQIKSQVIYMALFQIREYGTKNKKVIFFLAGWHIKQWVMWPFIRLFVKNGFYCISYTYENTVLTPDTARTVENVLEIKKDVLKRISELHTRGYKDITVCGNSFGSLITLLVANESPNVSKVILNTAGVDPAEAVWSWDKLFKGFKKSLVDQGLTLEKLQKVWYPINPLYHIDNLKGKKILLYLSRKDKAIPFKNGQRLANEFEKRNYDMQLIVNNKLGHLMSAIKNGLNTKVYLNFLKDKN